MKTKIIALALAATVLAGGAAVAQDAPPPPGPGPGHPEGLFLRADANKDGVVTRAELLATVDARFGKADADHDGRITAEERQALGKKMRDEADGHGRRGPRGGRMGPGARADANSDGILTLDEARAPALKLFAYVDRNNDGKIDKAERESFREAAMAMAPRGPRHRGHGRHGRHGPPPAGAPQAPNP